MSNDAAAQILGAHVVTSTPSAELWHRVARGELSADEAARQLLDERPDASEEERGEIERARQVFAPPTEERRQAQLEALLARRAALDDDEGRAVVVPMRPHRTRRWVVGLLAAAAAAVLAVVIVPPRTQQGEPFSQHYEIELDHAVARVRGTEPRPEVPTFLVDGKIGIRLVPEEAVEGAIGVVAYAWDGSGEARELSLEPKVYDNGVVELETTVQALGLGEGEWELVIAIGWADALPGSWEELAIAERDGTKGVEVMRTRVRVERR